MAKEVLYGLYNDDEILLSAIKKAREDHLDIMDVLTPFPVHGLDPILGLAESRLHIAGFFYGAMGSLTAFLFMTWVFTKDWPTIFGGKPYWSVPAFIPIIFEMTVLFACVGMVISFYASSGLWPGKVNPILDDRITDDTFCIAFDATNTEGSEIEKIKSFFQATGAFEVNTKVV